MNEVMNNILTRRSVRSYKTDAVPEELLMQVLQAGLYAPSAMNGQKWQFTVVVGAANREKLAAAVRRALGNPNYNFYEPPVLILVSNKKDNGNGQLDTGCAMENMFLAAHSLGLSTVWINQLKTICDEPDVREVLRSFGVPEDHVVLGTVALGYAGGEIPAAKERTGVVKIVK